MISSLMFMFFACGDKEQDTSVETEECVCECEQEVQDEDTAQEVVEEDPQDTSTPQE
jgi:hypothetical protein